MKGDDTAVSGVLSDVEQHVASVQVFGIVARNEVPHHHAVTLFDHDVLFPLHPSVWRTEEVGFQVDIGLVDISHVRADAMAQSANVVKGVVSQPVSACLDHFEHFGMFANVIAHHEKGGLDAVMIEYVENPRRYLGYRAVVKGQRHIFHHLRLCFRRFLHHRDAAPRPAAGQQHQRRQQRTYSLPHLITGESICSAAKKEHACRRVLFL